MLEINFIFQKKGTDKNNVTYSGFSLCSKPASLCSSLKCLLGSRFVAFDPLAHGLALQPTTKGKSKVGQTRQRER